MEQSKNTKILLDANENYVTIKLNGLLTVKDILDCFNCAVNHDDYERGMNRIWELSDAQFETIDSEDIDLVSNYSLVFPPKISDVKEEFASEAKGN